MRAYLPQSTGNAPGASNNNNNIINTTNSGNSEPMPSPVEDKSFWEAISTFAKVDFSSSRDAELLALRLTLDDFFPNQNEILSPPPSPFPQQQQQSARPLLQPVWTSAPAMQVPPPSPHAPSQQPAWTDRIQAPSPQVQGRNLLHAAPSYYQLPMFNNLPSIPFPSPRMATQSLSISPASSVRGGATLAPVDVPVALAKRHASPDRDRVKKVRSSDSDTASDCSGVPSTGSPLAIVGESRLKVRFDHVGDIGELPQRFGKSGLWVASRVSGTHEMYEQPWRFEVTQGEAVGSDTALVTWTIVNQASGTTVSITETAKQAKVRQNSGRTICNRVLKQALAVRYAELERILDTLQNNPTRAANVRSLMKVIAPRRCTVGLLFFGLLHECVQKKLQGQVRTGDVRARSMSQLDIEIDEADFQGNGGNLGHHSGYGPL